MVKTAGLISSKKVTYMRKTGACACLAAALTVWLATLALAAAAHPVAHVSACKLGQEASGCKLNGTAYDDPATRIIVGFPSSFSPKGTTTELSVPASFLCAGGGEANLVVKTKITARVGASLFFSGKAKVQPVAANEVISVASGNVTARLKIADAKKASLSGKAELTLKDGTKCSKRLSSKLLRVLGG